MHVTLGRVAGGPIAAGKGAAGFSLKLELEPHPVVNATVEAFKSGIDRSLLVENLRRSIDERLRLNADVQYFTDELRVARRGRGWW